MQMYEYPKVREMAENQAVEGFYLLKAASVKTSTSGKTRLSGKLSDMSGEVEFVLWDYADTVHETCLGAPVKIRGNVTSYNGALQVTVAMIRGATQQDNVDTDRLVPKAPIEMEKAFDAVRTMIYQEITDPDYRAICDAMLKWHAQMFAQLPAAKSVHHAFIGGVLMHTWMMMEHAKYLADLYSKVINKSLLLAATFCHDLNKDREYVLSPMGIVTDYSVEGSLLGHSYMGACQVMEIGKGLGTPKEKLMLLQHCLLAHHGEPEMGAAVRPMCAEADLLNLIDVTDAHMEIYREQFEVTEPGAFTDKVWAMDRKLYKPTEA